MPRAVHTIGHSNHSSDAFFGLLVAHGVRTLADVRAIPGSRRHPQFGRDALAVSSRAGGIAYHWMAGLGGRRRSPAGVVSPHVAWEVAAFRAYADYMDTPDFAAALAVLEDVAEAAPTAFMCAEALWWQCHRRLVSDRLLVAGWTVLHIGSGGHTTPHVLPDFARVVGGRVVYDVGVTLELPTPRSNTSRRARGAAPNEGQRAPTSGKR